MSLRSNNCIIIFLCFLEVTLMQDINQPQNILIQNDVTLTIPQTVIQLTLPPLQQNNNHTEQDLFHLIIEVKIDPKNCLFSNLFIESSYSPIAPFNNTTWKELSNNMNDRNFSWHYLDRSIIIPPNKVQYNQVLYIAIQSQLVPEVSTNTPKYSINMYYINRSPCVYQCHAGICGFSGCTCSAETYDYDCSLKATKLTPGQASTLVLPPYKWVFAYWIVTTVKVSAFINIKMLKSIEVDLQYSNWLYQIVDMQTAFSNNIKTITKNTLWEKEINIDNKGGKELFFAYYNPSLMSKQIDIIIDYQSNESDKANIGMIIGIIIACIVFIAIVVIVIVKRAQKIRMLRQQQIQLQQQQLQQINVQGQQQQPLTQQIQNIQPIECNQYWIQQQNPENQQQQQEENKSIINHQCPICLLNFDNIQNISVTQCNHTFHTQCINNWLSAKQTCPNCRNPINISTLKPKY